MLSSEVPFDFSFGREGRAHKESPHRIEIVRNKRGLASREGRILSMENGMDGTGIYEKKRIRKERSRRKPIGLLLFLTVCLFLEGRGVFGNGGEDPWQLLLRQYAKDPGTDRLILVQYLGGSKGELVMLKKEQLQGSSEGEADQAKSGEARKGRQQDDRPEAGASCWQPILACTVYMGKEGLGKAREGDGRTPAGVFQITEAFGILENPGTELPYTKIQEFLYWSEEPDTYNQMVDVRELGRSKIKGEHLIEYAPQYHYALVLDYNKEGVYPKGSAIFLHVKGEKPYTAGCLAVSEAQMKRIVQNSTCKTKICIMDENGQEGASFAPGVTEAMSDPEYWLESCESRKEILWSKEEIQGFNQMLLEEGLLADIQNVSWEARPLFYGICTERADIREFPSKEPAWSDPEDPYFDENQLTAFRVNTPVLVDQVTEDGAFCHVRSADYEGWTECEKIALCSSRQQWLEAQQMDRFLVVTVPRLRLEITGELLTMGTRLRLLSQAELEQAFPSGEAWGCYGAELPIRKPDGTYGTKTVTIPVGAGIREGFLSFNRENLLDLMFPFLGQRYGWGGMYESVDCSGFVQEVLACFGFAFPRDGKDQWKTPLPRYTFLPSMTRENREAVLHAMEPGDLLYFPGHIMFYLGQAGGEDYVLSAAGTVGELSVRRVVINPLSVSRKNGSTWFQELTAGLLF